MCYSIKIVTIIVILKINNNISGGRQYFLVCVLLFLEKFKLNPILQIIMPFILFYTLRTQGL